MSEKGKLSTSRKFSKGAIHETATGQFSILDRYLNEGAKMLRIQWLTGPKQGTVDQSLERTMNSLIFKFNASRGLPQWAEAEKQDKPGLMEKVDDTLTMVMELKEMMIQMQDELKALRAACEKNK